MSDVDTLDSGYVAILSVRLMLPSSCALVCGYHCWSPEENPAHISTTGPPSWPNNQAMPSQPCPLFGRI